LLRGYGRGVAAAAAHEEASGSGLRTARKIFFGLLAIEFAVLAGTGQFLVFGYRPEASQSWTDVGRLSSGVHLWAVARLAHRTTSSVFLATALGAAVVAALHFRARRASEESTRARRRSLGLLLGIGLFPLALFASFTGYLLPWDQLALWAVTVGTNMRGYRPIFGHQVKFVLMGGVEIDRETLVRWLFVHLVVGGPLIALFIVAAWSLVHQARERTTAKAALPVRQ
jgi:quinol-cytochrome oxidoreductase complex cytochrome b subunit